MRKLFLIICLGFSIYLSVRGFGLVESLKLIKCEQSGIKKELIGLKEELRRLEKLTPGDIGTVNENYDQIIERLRQFSNSLNFKTLIELKKGNDEHLFIKEKHQKLSGVGEVELKLSLFDIPDSDRLLSILGFIENVEKRFPLSINGILYKNNKLDMDIKIYGRCL